jgi:hypothetical protein
MSATQFELLQTTRLKPSAAYNIAALLILSFVLIAAAVVFAEAAGNA